MCSKKRKRETDAVDEAMEVFLNSRSTPRAETKTEVFFKYIAMQCATLPLLEQLDFQTSIQIQLAERIRKNDGV